jgi:hypothetical protein
MIIARLNSFIVLLTKQGLQKVYSKTKPAACVVTSNIIYLFVIPLYNQNCWPVIKATQTFYCFTFD